MAWVDPSTPNLADFTTYCQNQGIVATYTASSSEYFQWAFNWSMADAMVCPNMPTIRYVLAVYELGADRFITIAQDDGQGTFYQTQRTTFGVLEFRPGVVMASGDGPTSQTLVVPDWYRELPLAAQEQIKTPWGRRYLAYAQMYGPYVVGVT
jgi:hypothetical protein